MYIQNYKDLEAQVNKVNKIMYRGQIQKIFSTPQYIVFVIRVLGKNVYLGVGRGSGFEAILIGDNPPPSSIRVRDKYLELLRANLLSMYIDSIELDKLDRVVGINTKSSFREVGFYFFYKGREKYFVLQKSEQGKKTDLLKSWNQKFVTVDKKLPHSEIFDVFNEVGRKDIDKIKSEKIILTLDDVLTSEEKGENKKISKKALSKKSMIEKEIQKCLTFEKFSEHLESDLTKNASLEIDGVKIKFSKEENQFQRRDKLYRKIKSLKAGLSIQQKRLADIKPEQQEIIEKTNNQKTIQPVWRKTENKKDQSDLKEQEFQVFQFEGVKMGVGKSAYGNDQLRKNWASEDDWWFHLDGGDKSAHVIVKKSENFNNDDLILRIIASLLSAKEDEEKFVNIIYTKVKNIRAVKGTSGLVTYKHQKHLMVQRIKDYKERIQ